MIGLFLQSLRRVFRSRAALQAENLAFHHQLAVLTQRLGRRRLRLTATVVGWHRKLFTAYGCWKSRPRGGRARIDAEIRERIARMASENPLWGAPRIQGELLMLGFRVSEPTVSRYLRLYHRRPPSQTWHSFVQNHLYQSIAVDFMVVPTIRFSQQLQRVINAYGRHYNGARTHLSLAKRTPDGRRTPTKHRGRVVADAHIGRLHHRYDRLAA